LPGFDERRIRVAEHIVLLGDSIFDNAAYTQGLPDVATHLHGLLTEGCKASLLAVDGSTTAELGDQLADLEPSVTRAVVSIGGNDALENIEMLSLPVRSTHEALILFGRRIGKFEEDYRTAIRRVVERVPNTTVCTIYNGNLPEEQARTARIALMLFNDVILRTAFALRLPVINLRLICSEPSDYANPIEPSGSGGEKIARAIAVTLGWGKGHASSSYVFAG
jgi:hypothetical protein